MSKGIVYGMIYPTQKKKPYAPEEIVLKRLGKVLQRHGINLGIMLLIWINLMNGGLKNGKFNLLSRVKN
jgi:hypothetical protein